MRLRAERGMSLIELMVAMVVLAIGLGAVSTLLVTAIASNHRNSTDTTATLLAQMVVEQIGAQHPYAEAPIYITDCAGTQHEIATDPGTFQVGDGANLKADGTIDFTQDPTSLKASSYAMDYVDCSTAGGVQTTYDVRWNVMSVSANAVSKMITAAARPLASSANKFGGLYFAIPVTIRSVGAPGAMQ